MRTRFTTVIVVAGFGVLGGHRAAEVVVAFEPAGGSFPKGSRWTACRDRKENTCLQSS